MPRKKLKHILEKDISNISNISNLVKSENSSTQHNSLNEVNPNIEKKSNSDNQTIINEEDIIEISQLRGKEVWHYSMLEKFFSNCELPIIQKMVDIINGNHLVSLRFMDWFVTRYCYLYKATINVANKFCTQNNFSINISYKAQLKSFTKKYFDPFKRKKKFIYSLDKYKVSFLTTLGQLNFFRWAITNDIINYTETNYKTIISKYDYVNSFFKKHSSNSSTNSTLTSNMSLSTNSLNTKSDSNDDNSIINEIYTSKNPVITVDNLPKKSTYNLPRVSRNICIEL